MNETIPEPGERISALVDGCLQGDDLARAMDDLLSHPQSLQTWHTFHVVGDVLRSSALAPSDDGFAFWQRLEGRLALEPARPVVIAEDTGTYQLGLVALPSPDVVAVSANASVFRWKALAGFSFTALVGAVGLALWTQSSAPGAAQLAAVAVQARPEAQITVSEAGAGIMIRDPQLDALMAAHQQLGGHSALQMPAGFLRNATYAGPAR